MWSGCVGSLEIRASSLGRKFSLLMCPSVRRSNSTLRCRSPRVVNYLWTGKAEDVGNEFEKLKVATQRDMDWMESHHVTAQHSNAPSRQLHSFPRTGRGRPWSLRPPQDYRVSNGAWTIAKITKVRGFVRGWHTGTYLVACRRNLKDPKLP